MYCEYILKKVVEFKGDIITLYLGNFYRNFKNGYLTGHVRFSAIVTMVNIKNHE